VKRESWLSTRKEALRGEALLMLRSLEQADGALHYREAVESLKQYYCHTPQTSNIRKKIDDEEKKG